MTATAYAEILTELGDDTAALALANAADLEGRDWGAPHATIVDAIMEACMILQSWESPEWGNVGGRYGVNFGAGGLTGAEYDALEEVDTTVTDTTGDPRFEMLELDGWDVHALSVYARHCAERGPSALVALVDALSAAHDRWESEGRY